MNDAGDNRGHGEWELWFREWGPRLLLFARQHASDPAEAEDLVQEAFVRLWREGRRDGKPAPGRLFQLVRLAAIDAARRRRRRWRREQAVAAPAAHGPCPEPWFEPDWEQGERARLAEEGLRRLPVAQREVLVLRIWGGLTFEEIGKTLGISPHTAASRYRYALQKLREFWPMEVSP
ncbi:MAG: sigma-70 family RNA polymerase sigma factor [Verrucomicrobia bacterium]|nr:MAG: sigma-70 family RNA polymerase sigma factor [Verrucomicrobiota bacterium]